MRKLVPIRDITDPNKEVRKIWSVSTVLYDKIIATIQYMKEKQKTPWAVICQNCGQVHLSAAEYEEQLMRPDDTWRCPDCGEPAEFDDVTYEIIMRSENDDEDGIQEPITPF